MKLCYAPVVLLYFVLPSCDGLCGPSMRPAVLFSQRSPPPSLGLFDMFKESDAQKAAKEAEWRAQQEIMERRRNPEKMAAYEAEVQARRMAVAEDEAELKQLQKEGGAQALKEWNRLKAEGKLMASDDMEREAGDRSWGGEGLVAERIDEKLPYIDSGYVDESQPDIMGTLGKLFGGGDKKD